MVEEFLEGKNDYPEEALLLGESTKELERLADFAHYFLKKKNINAKIYFGSKTLGTLYLHKHKQIHLQIANLNATLHEIGHAIYGESESKACTFSTSLIMKTEQMKNQIPIFEKHKLINIPTLA